MEINPDNRPLTNFYSNSIITQKNIGNFYPGDIAKITVVIWLEGEDPDCNDDILGGQFKTDVVDASATTHTAYTVMGNVAEGALTVSGL